MRPKGCGNKLDVIAQRNSRIIMAGHILTNIQRPAVVEFIQVEQLVELVIAGNNYYLPVVLRRPVPKRMLGVVVIADIADVAGQYKYIAGHFQWILFQIAAVLRSDAYCIFILLRR